MDTNTMLISEAADQIAENLGIDEHSATSAIDTYIEQLGWDTNELTQEQADELQAIIKSAMRAGDMGTRELEELSDAAREFHAIESQYRQLQEQRDTLIRKATLAGARQVDIADTTGLSTTRIRKITNG